MQHILQEREIEGKKGRRTGAGVAGSDSLQDLKNAPPRKGLDF